MRRLVPIRAYQDPLLYTQTIETMFENMTRNSIFRVFSPAFCFVLKLDQLRDSRYYASRSHGKNDHHSFNRRPLWQHRVESLQP
jgi:hypothetical protein